MGFVKPGKTGITCNTVTNYRQEDEELWASGTFTWGGNVEPGTYRLFVRAPEGDLQDVEGAVTICRADRTVPFALLVQEDVHQFALVVAVLALPGDAHGGICGVLLLVKLLLQRLPLKVPVQCYDDGYIAFFAQALSAVEDSEIIGAMAERAYQDKQISFFSILAGELDEEKAPQPASGTARQSASSVFSPS